MLKNLQSNYSKNSGYIQISLPIDTEYIIPVDDSVRLLNQVLEDIDYRKLYLAYSSEGRNPAIEPKTLFKVIVYAYSQGIFSSREIEKACKLNLAFIYLLGGQKTPDHNTISRFRKERLSNCIDDLFTQLVNLLSELDEVQFENLYLDGTKIEANANKYTFVWKGAITKSQDKLQINCREYLTEIGISDIPEFIDSEYIKTVMDNLIDLAAMQHIEFVHGSGKRKTDIQRQIEKLQDFYNREKKYEESNLLFNGRNSYSKTDTDATFMHLKEDHMRNGQLKAAYNVQVGVDSEYIVGVDIYQNRADSGTLIPFMDKMEERFGRKYKNLVADAGYESEENYRYLEEQEITPYIKPSNYEYSKTRKFQRDMEFRLAMNYDEGTDTYTCKGNRKLTFLKNKTAKSATGYLSTKRVYGTDSCEGCKYYGTCYKGKYGKTIEVCPTFDSYREASKKNITSELGILLRVNRSIQVEGSFGIVKQDYGFKRFLTRGKKNVLTEYTILAIAFDINKLHNRIQGNRIGQHLFKIQETA